MATARITEYGNKLLPHLIYAAQKGMTPTYQEVANKIGIHHRVMNHALGYIRDEIVLPRGLPMINAIVINSDTRLPGESWLPQGTSHLSPEEYKQEYEKFRDMVFAYQGWRDLLRELDLEPVQGDVDDIDERGRKYSEIQERNGGSGEGVDHLQLKEFVAAHPEAIGLEKESAVQMEYFFVSGDRADIVFGTGPDTWAIAEIKNGLPGELEKGIYQIIKYRALLQAEKGHRGYVQVDPVLVAYAIPSEITRFASRFGIRCKIIRREQL
ncbi:MAG TPA: hypothetical protein VK206_06705 [Anaerolineales bacterium]|nr:hypothetical protein [Anaerolineales bacterium]HLO33343.1 hypothetical protein [Anaerolineales bacterium]